MQRSYAARVLLWLIFLGSFLLAIGGCVAQQRFVQRGISPDLPQPIDHAGVRLGINVALEQYDDAQLNATLDAISGTAYWYLKQSFYWTPDFDWNASDRLIDAIKARPHLTLVPLLDGNPANQFAPPEDPQQFADWTRQFAARYGDFVDYYIVWDEPNLASHWGGEKVNPDEYAALLSAAGAGVKSADPHAFIIAAPLAPTTETNSINLADPLYLEALYEAEAPFDIAAGKPYGFDHPPDDRAVGIDTLNFGRIISLREVMIANGDGNKALWAGNWGWNALPDEWTGNESIWGETTQFERTLWTTNALQRARREWDWMGVMFLENWEPDAPPDDPRWGFSIAQSELAQIGWDGSAAYPGFHPASQWGVGQTFIGDWRFSPEFGVDVSEKHPELGETPDRMTFDFWGTDIAIRIRRADFRSRFYVTVDGEPANALPHDENGAVLILDSPNPNEDFVSLEPVATGLDAGYHTLELVAHRGWDQWALNGFSVGYQPPSSIPLLVCGLWGLVALAGAMVVIDARRADWQSVTKRWQTARRTFRTQRKRVQLALLTLVASILSLTGWLTWGSHFAGVYRRLGDHSQLALTAGLAAIFYVTPYFIVYVVALVLLIILISFRPVWGVALIAFSIPFYARTELLKSMSVYRFSPTEIFTLATLIAVIIAWVTMQSLAIRSERVTLVPARLRLREGRARNWFSADVSVALLTIVATISLFFTERIGVATNEWRVLIVEAALFYGLLRVVRPSSTEMWTILDAFILSGVMIALYGLAQAVFGFQALITAEGGLLRVQSIYGSPNNVALYLGRILPILLAVTLFGTGRRRTAYAIFAAICGVTMLLTFSKGGLLLGLPTALLILFAFWLRQRQWRVLPWLGGAIVLGIIAFLAMLQIPQLAARLNIIGDTSFVRVNLWRSSIEMIKEHPIFGVGLDNFLYAYRGRYILAEAWREPNLNHPHNFFFDFATRLGLVGLIAGIYLFATLGDLLRQLIGRLREIPSEWQPVVIGLVASFGHIILHGMVDHSFFLIDLAFSFYLLLGLAHWLSKSTQR